MEVEIIPAVLVDNSELMQKQFDLVAGEVNRVHVDIIDGVFVDNKTITLEELEKVRTDLPMDVHLMVNEPVGFLARCDRVGVERVYAQVEQMSDKGEFVEMAGDLGIQVGLALDIHTPVSSIYKLLPHLDGVILMSIEVGFQGRKFDKKVLAKISEVRGREFLGDICIDGGMDVGTIPLCKERGANHFGVGSALWKAKDIKKKILELKGLVTA